LGGFGEFRKGRIVSSVLDIRNCCFCHCIAKFLKFSATHTMLQNMFVFQIVYKNFASLHVHVNCDMFHLEGRGVREVSDCFLSLLDSTELNLALRGCPVAIAETAATISVSIRLP
jgi:hypothetical protein